MRFDKTHANGSPCTLLFKVQPSTSSSFVLLSFLLLALALVLILLLGCGGLAINYLSSRLLFFFLLFIVLCSLILLHPTRIVLFGRFIRILCIGVNALCPQVSPPLLLSHDVRGIGGALHLLRAALFILVALFGCASLRPSPVDFPLVASCHTAIIKLS